MNHRGISDRRKPHYIAGVHEFLEFAFGQKEDGTEVRCPHMNCNLCLFRNRSTIHNHLIVRGILRNYNPWIHHGEYGNHINSSDDWIEEASDRAESFVVCNDMRPLVHEVMSVMNFGNVESNEDHTENEGDQNEMLKEFYKLMEDVEAELFSGCKTFTRLEFIVTLLHIKVSCK